MAMYYGDENGKAQEVVVVGMQGPAGPQGPQGATGPQGPAGQGVPAGGTAGQVLTKSETGAEWKDKLTLIATSTDGTMSAYEDGVFNYIIANKSIPPFQLSTAVKFGNAYIMEGKSEYISFPGADFSPNTTSFNVRGVLTVGNAILPFMVIAYISGNTVNFTVYQPSNDNLPITPEVSLYNPGQIIAQWKKS